MKKIIVSTFTIALLLTMNANGQNNNSELTFGVNHIAIAVTDLEESEYFYRDIIGLKQIPEPFGLGIHAWFEVGSTQLHVIKAAEERTERNKYTHICFSVNDMDAFIEKISEHNLEYSDWNLNPGEITTRVDGVKQIYFTDPDGYWIEVNDEMLE